MEAVACSMLDSKCETLLGGILFLREGTPRHSEGLCVRESEVIPLTPALQTNTGGAGRMKPTQGQVEVVEAVEAAGWCRDV
jgi:hypothetical protein